MPKKKGDLSQEQFDALLQWLDADREQAGKKYATMHQKLVTLFQKNGFSPAEEHADEVFNRAARRLSDPKEGQEILTNDPWRFLYGIAKKMLAFERHRSRESSFEELAENPEFVARFSNDAEEYVVTEEERIRDECLEKCLGELSQEDQELLEDYYKLGIQPNHPSHRELQERYGLSDSGLRTRVMRIKEKLGICVQKCMRTGGK